MKLLFLIVPLVMTIGGIFIRQLGFELPPPAIIGIDLGTTQSSVVVFQSGAGVLILNNTDGNSIIPSIVSFTERGTVVGRRAKQRLKDHPLHTIYDVKRFIGKKFDDPQLQADLLLLPYKIINNTQGEPRIVVPPINNFPERIFSAEEISSLILIELKSMAEKHFSKEISKVVIAVPVKFTSSQRRATERAAGLAGFGEVNLITEPTSASIAYGQMEHSVWSEVLVFDFGGGTLDTALLAVENNLFRTLAVSGDPHLGGEDFTSALAQYLSDTLPCGKELSHEVVRGLAEESKIKLSLESSTTLQYDCPRVEEDVMFREEHELSRAEFEKVAAELVARAIWPVLDVLKKADYSGTDVDAIVMVGGSSRIPAVQEAVKNALPGVPLITSVQPELAVAIGCSIHAGTLTNAWPLPASAVEVPFDDEI